MEILDALDILEKLKENNFVWLALTICTFISVPLAIYFGRKSLEKKTILITISNKKLITNKQSNISKLEILYDNKSVDKLTVTEFTFWNSSLQTIHDTDIIAAAPLSIFIENGKILEVSVLLGENTPNKISASLVNDTAATITFDYLDKSEGGVIKIVHTGDCNSINITRKIKGGTIKLYRPMLKIVILLLCFYLTSIIIPKGIAWLYSSISVSEILFLFIFLCYEASFIIIGIMCFHTLRYTFFTPKNCK